MTRNHQTLNETIKLGLLCHCLAVIPAFVTTICKIQGAQAEHTRNTSARIKM